jgi:hypothetical protein
MSGLAARTVSLRWVGSRLTGHAIGCVGVATRGRALVAKVFACPPSDNRNLNLNHLVANRTDFDFASNVYAAEYGITYEDVVNFQR